MIKQTQEGFNDLHQSWIEKKERIEPNVLFLAEKKSFPNNFQNINRFFNVRGTAAFK
jgi:hypothetical protein